jgi:LysR family transcriptional regulator for metE and metH
MPVFAYEQVLVVCESHPLARQPFISPHQLNEETLLTYPVERNRLDIFTQFLTPAHSQPARHKSIEDTDIMLQLVAANRGVCALPKWLAEDYQARLKVCPVSLGVNGIQKHIYLGFRDGEDALDYVSAFFELAKKAAV